MSTRSTLVDKLSQLEGYIERLEDLSETSLEELREDPMVSAATERVLHLALESCLDIGQVIVSHEGEERPDSYREVITILGEIGVLDPDFAEAFAPAAGLRNVLVHRYTEVDLERVHRFLRDELEDLRSFREAVAAYAKDLDDGGD